MSNLFFKFLCTAVLTFSTSLPVQAEPDRPLIVIPGIVGSELSDPSGKIIWGRASSLRSSNFRQLNLLPAQGEAVSLEPTDALRAVPLVFGAINIGVYSGIIDFLTGETSIFDSAAQREILGDYTEGTDLFVFAYDWRRSNFANAVLLNEFVAANIPNGKDFDIVAHSMGGLLTRAFLSDQRPVDICTDPTQESPLPPDQTEAACKAAYGVLGETGWRGTNDNNHFSESGRLHTFIEIATPHRGSVNVASTLVEGWGRLSQILIGGKRDIQDILLSMLGPYELTPTYDNCCALGQVGRSGNSAVATLDETYWAKLVLGFEVTPCPYTHCAIKRELLRIGLGNRALLDQVFESGLPDTVRANHVMIGRLVENTRETIYVDRSALGDGQGLSYRTSARGDGTVYEGSAKAPGNQAFVLRAKHPFIVGSEEVHRYVYNILIDPVRDVPSMVNSSRIFVGGGDIDSLALTALPQIAGQGQVVALQLNLNAIDAQPFDPDLVADAAVVLSAMAYGGDTPVWQSTAVPDSDLSFSAGGTLVYSTTFEAPAPGVYLMSATIDGREIAQDLLHVLEE